MAEKTPDFLASLGVALERLNAQLGEASQAYQDCLARYAEEKQHRVGKVECNWDELGTGAADWGPDLEAPAAFVGARDDDAAPPALLPQPLRTSFAVALALPAPKGDAPPHVPNKAWTKVVRHEAEHSAANHEAAQDLLKMSMSDGDSNPEDKVEVQMVSEACSDVQEPHCDSDLMEQMIGQRLLSRLGHRSTRALVSGHDLHQAVSAMGLERYTLKEMNYFVYRMSMLIKLEFRQLDKPAVTQPLSPYLNARWSHSELISLSERAVWAWPEVCKDASWPRPSQQGHVGIQDMPADQNGVFIPIKALIKAMTEPDVVVKKLLGFGLGEQLFAIKEVLVTGDANRLVSELTCVRIDDLATRSPEPEFSVLELVVGLLIIANGLVVGLQTQEREGSEWGGWFWIEVGFTCVFFLEILLRLCLHGLKPFLYGADRAWNLFDVFLACVGIVECGLMATHDYDVSYPPMLRFIRLLKLMRLVRILRLRFMWELQLMIKGLLGGARTLCWAFVLLVFVLYILGVLTYSAFAEDADESIREMFSDIPTAMFTSFRCVTSDCFTRAGNSATGLLMHTHGFWFAASFFATYISITLGVFNVILAIYVETTMTAAKQSEDANKGSKERASIRVAHVTKRLLKLFCAAERSFNGVKQRRPSLDMRMILSASVDSTEILDSTSISKELFLMVIQEPEVKKLMDELDLPPDRANLFDSIDADGSGSLEATELVRGLLKVRGEVKKSDQVACILALRAVQAKLREMGTDLQDNRRILEDLRSAAVSPDASKTE